MVRDHSGMDLTLMKDRRSPAPIRRRRYGNEAGSVIS
jgi:hypothetical protein